MPNSYAPDPKTHTRNLFPLKRPLSSLLSLHDYIYRNCSIFKTSLVFTLKWTSFISLSLYLSSILSHFCLPNNSSFFMEEKKSTEVKSISSSPLFSTIITIYILILLYFPAHFLEIIFSPVLILTGILLLFILRLGAIQRTQKELNSTQLPQQQQEQEQQIHDYNYDNHIWDSCDTKSGSGYDPNPFYAGSFVEWNVRAPLEIIYEAYEGEEEDVSDDHVLNDKQEKGVLGIERYPSLSLYYPESDSDSSSDGDYAVIGNWGTPERMVFLWEEEDRDGLIEIALDGKRRSQFFNIEEENLIEIDISPARNDEFSSEC